MGNKSVKARKPKEKIKHRNSGGNQEMKSNMVGTKRNAITLNEMPLIPIPGIPVDSSLSHLKGSSQVLGGSSPIGKYLVTVVTPHLPKPWISATWKGKGNNNPRSWGTYYITILANIFTSTLGWSSKYPSTPTKLKMPSNAKQIHQKS